MLSHSFLCRTILQFLILTENLRRVLKNQQNLFNSVSFDRVLFMTQYFLGRTLQTQAISDRTTQGSVLSCRTFLVPHFQRENIVWFNIIGQNVFGSRFSDTKPFSDLALLDETFHGSGLSVRTFQGLVLLYRTTKRFCTCCRIRNNSAKLHFFLD